MHSIKEEARDTIRTIPKAKENGDSMETRSHRGKDKGMVQAFNPEKGKTKGKDPRRSLGIVTNAAQSGTRHATARNWVRDSRGRATTAAKAGIHRTRAHSPKVLEREKVEECRHP